MGRPHGANEEQLFCDVVASMDRGGNPWRRAHSSQPALRMRGGVRGNGRCMSHVTSLGGGQGGGELTQEMGAGQGGGELAREMHEGRRPRRKKGHGEDRS